MIPTKEKSLQRDINDNNNLVHALLSNRKRIQTYIQLESKKNNEFAAENVKRHQSSLARLETKLYDTLVDSTVKNSEIIKSMNERISSDNAKNSKPKNVNSRPSKSPAKPVKVSENIQKHKSTPYKSSLVNQNPEFTINSEMNNIKDEYEKKIDFMLNKYNKQMNNRKSANEASKRQKDNKHGLLGYKRRLKKFNDSKLFKLLPFKTIGMIENNINSLQEEKSYWKDRKLKYRSKLIVVTLRGSREAEIKNADKNIKRIDGLIKVNEQRLIAKNKIVEDKRIKQEAILERKKVLKKGKEVRKQGTSIFNSIKNTAYRMTGAEKEDQQTKVSDFKDLDALRKDFKNATKKDKENPNNFMKFSLLTVLDEVEKEAKKEKGNGSNSKIDELLKSNKEIYKKLSEIEENMIDEQDTTIKKTKVSDIGKDITTKTEVEKTEEKDGMWSSIKSLFGSLLGGVLGSAGFGFLKLLGKFGLSAMSTLFKIAVKGIMAIPGLGTFVTSIIKGTSKLVSAVIKPIMKIISKILSFIGLDLDVDPDLDKNKDKDKKKDKKKTKTKTSKIPTGNVANKAGKAGFKTLLKKIPGVSIIAGSAFAVSELSEGNWGRAGAELASGIAGTVPGLGTWISSAIDVGLYGESLLPNNTSVMDSYSNDDLTNMRDPARTSTMSSGFSSNLGKYEPIANLIGKYESRNSYIAYNSGTAGNNGKVGHSGTREDLTSLSLNEILQKSQISSSKDKDRIFAAGRYQIIPSTLKNAMRVMGLKGTEIFTPELQDRIFVEALLPSNVKKYINGSSSDVKGAMLSLAKTWRALPDPNTGLTYADSGAGANKALVSVQTVAGILNSSKGYVGAGDAVLNNPNTDSINLDNKKVYNSNGLTISESDKEKQRAILESKGIPIPDALKKTTVVNLLGSKQSKNVNIINNIKSEPIKEKSNSTNITNISKTINTSTEEKPVTILSLFRN